jgi:hypothetical protein
MTQHNLTDGVDSQFRGGHFSFSARGNLTQKLTQDLTHPFVLEKTVDLIAKPERTYACTHAKLKQRAKSTPSIKFLIGIKTVIPIEGPGNYPLKKRLFSIRLPSR